MNEGRFDQLARSLAQETSRRRLLRGLTAGTMATGLVVLGGRGVDARPRGIQGEGASAKPVKPTHPTKPAKVGVCHATGDVKQPYRLITVSDRSLKGHLKHGDYVATDMTSDVNNCGGCGATCDTPADACSTVSCVDGMCMTTDTDCDDGNECTIDSCDLETGCVHSPVADEDLVACGEDGTGVCVAGTCQTA